MGCHLRPGWAHAVEASAVILVLDPQAALEHCTSRPSIDGRVLPFSGTTKAQHSLFILTPGLEYIFPFPTPNFLLLEF